MLWTITFPSFFSLFLSLSSFSHRNRTLLCRYYSNSSSSHLLLFCWLIETDLRGETFVWDFRLIWVVFPSCPLVFLEQRKEEKIKRQSKSPFAIRQNYSFSIFFIDNVKRFRASKRDSWVWKSNVKRYSLPFSSVSFRVHFSHRKIFGVKLCVTREEKKESRKCRQTFSTFIKRSEKTLANNVYLRTRSSWWFPFHPIMMSLTITFCGIPSRKGRSWVSNLRWVRWTRCRRRLRVEAFSILKEAGQKTSIIKTASRRCDTVASWKRMTPTSLKCLV